MGIRLGGYVRDRRPITVASASLKLLVLAGVVVLHVGVLSWWSSRPADRAAEREYVTYYDIAPLTAPIPSTIPEAVLPVEQVKPPEEEPGER